ncbi:MAG: CoA pyrophosphatase [Pseudomonadota bacterium]
MTASGTALNTLTADEFRARATGRLYDHWEPNRPDRRSDYDLNKDIPANVRPKVKRDAAVLIPIVNWPASDATVILTRRTEHLPSHAGQVSFPGGKIDAGEVTPLETALREANEEIGLKAEAVAPIGFLDPYITSTGYRVHPVVGLVQPHQPLTPEPGEVAEIFEVPLGFLMDDANHKIEGREWQGVTRYFYSMPFGRHYIWGATAGMIRLLYERVFVE